MFFIDILCPHYPFCRRYQGQYYHPLILENHFFLPAALGLIFFHIFFRLYAHLKLGLRLKRYFCILLKHKKLNTHLHLFGCKLCHLN